MLTRHQNEDLQQRRILAGIWLLRELIQDSLDPESDQDDGDWREDVHHLDYVLRQQETNLTCQMVGPPDEDECAQTMLAVVRELAADRGLVDVPARKPGKKRGSCWIRLAKLPGNALAH